MPDIDYYMLLLSLCSLYVLGWMIRLVCFYRGQSRILLLHALIASAGLFVAYTGDLLGLFSYTDVTKLIALLIIFSPILIANGVVHNEH